MKRSFVVWSLLRKDLLDLFRQRRVWTLILITPLFSLPVALLVPGLVARHDARIRVVPGTVALQATGEHHVVDQFLKRQAFNVIESRDAVGSVLSHKADVAVNLTPDADSQLRASKGVAATLSFLAISSRSRATVANLALALSKLDTQIIPTRLNARGISLDAANAIAVAPQDLSHDPRSGRFTLSRTIPTFLVLELLGTLIYGAALLVEEKDHRTFEPLLMLPATRLELVLAKALAALVLGLLSVVVFVGPLAVIGRIAHSVAGEPLSISLPVAVGVAGIGAALAATFAAASTLLGAYAKSANESSALMTFLVLPVGALAFVLELFPDSVPSRLALFALPVVGPMLALRDFLSGLADPVRVATCVVGALVQAYVMLTIARRSIDSERSVLRST